MNNVEKELEIKAMDLLKSKWSHLYTFGYPKRPFPTNYENDLNCVLLGLYKSEKTYSYNDMVNFAKQQCDNLVETIKKEACVTTKSYFEASDKEIVNGVEIWEDNGSLCPTNIAIVNTEYIDKIYNEFEIK